MRFAVIMMGLLVVSCADRHAGGPSSVETQNSVAGILLGTDGSPIVGARAWLYRASALSAPLDSQWTDQNGEYFFRVRDTGLYSIEFLGEEGTSGRVLQRGRVDSSKIFTRLSTPIRLSIDAQGVLGRGTVWQVFAYGSRGEWLWDPETALVAEFPGKGVYALRFTGSGAVRDELIYVHPDLRSVRLSGETAPSVLLTDFDGVCEQNFLGYILGGSWGFVVTDQMVLDPGTSPEDFSTTCQLDAERGRALHLSYRPQVTAKQPWVALGMMLGLGQVGVDLQEMDSLVFWARGTGNVHAGIVTADVMDLTDYSYARSPDLTLSAQWRRYAIAASALRFPSGSQAEKAGLSWEISSRRSLMVQWVSTGEGEIWLDEIRLVGITLPELW